MSPSAKEQSRKASLVVGESKLFSFAQNIKFQFPNPQMQLHLSEKQQVRSADAWHGSKDQMIHEWVSGFNTDRSSQRRPWAVDRTSNPEQHGLPMSGSHTHRVISELERAKTQGSFGVAEEIYTSLKQNPVFVGTRRMTAVDNSVLRQAQRFEEFQKSRDNSKKVITNSFHTPLGKGYPAGTKELRGLRAQLGHVNRFFYNNNGVNANESQTFPVADDNPEDSPEVHNACFKEREVALMNNASKDGEEVSSQQESGGSLEAVKDFNLITEAKAMPSGHIQVPEYVWHTSGQGQMTLVEVRENIIAQKRWRKPRRVNAAVVDSARKKNRIDLEASFDEGRVSKIREKRTEGKTHQPQVTKLIPGTALLNRANEGLINPSSQRVLERLPAHQDSSRRPCFCKHHPWCSMPCIECAAMDKYLFSDGVIRVTGPTPGVGVVHRDYLDFASINDALGLTGLPRFREAPPVKNLQRLKVQIQSKRQELYPSGEPKGASLEALSMKRVPCTAQFEMGCQPHDIATSSERSRRVMNHLKKLKEELECKLNHIDSKVKMRSAILLEVVDAHALSPRLPRGDRLIDAAYDGVRRDELRSSQQERRDKRESRPTTGVLLPSYHTKPALLKEEDEGHSPLMVKPWSPPKSASGLSLDGAGPHAFGGGYAGGGSGHNFGGDAYRAKPIVSRGGVGDSLGDLFPLPSPHGQTHQTLPVTIGKGLTPREVPNSEGHGDTRGVGRMPLGDRRIPVVVYSSDEDEEEDTGDLKKGKFKVMPFVKLPSGANVKPFSEANIATNVKPFDERKGAGLKVKVGLEGKGRQYGL